MRLTVIIPAFNEALALPATVASVSSYLESWGRGEWEIIVVNDGSSDSTAEVATSLASPSIRVLHLERNRGKGAALVAGARSAADGYVLLMDADSSTPIAELAKLWSALQSADIAFASRALSGSSITAHQPWYRELAGKAGNLLIRSLLLPGVADSQCGFKLLAPAALPVLRQVSTQRWGFDVELLAMANAQNLRLAEVPVEWRHDATSAVGIGSYIGTLGEVAKIWWKVKSSKRDQ
jgi:dolichyl-phosphate beta-glucosyltransferase